MTDQKLRRLSRQELLELLCDTEKENIALRRENSELKEALSSRELHLEKAGSIAEAALSLHEVFERAQAAADDYLRNLYAAGEQMEQQRLTLLEETVEQCRRMRAGLGIPEKEESDGQS